ncbi:MAG: glycyl-radical enzyme activating protein [Clostridia bacterium]|nr:glycyl-radical enzyme activating protein [Clostridia bacterium]
MNETALIFDIKRYAVYDGPGIRATVFFKGCNLACAWCQNPESIGGEADIALEAARCVACGRRMAVCPAYDEDTGKRLRNRCVQCWQCTEACPTGARRRKGIPYTPQQLLDAVLIDKPFFDRSGGGVTCSGGEALLQADFLAEFLALCKNAGVSTAIDTAGNVPWASFIKVLPVCDLFLYDIKLFDLMAHKRITGAGNARILGNLLKLRDKHARLVARIPLIPGVTDLQENLSSIARFLVREMPAAPVQLLPYNPLAEIKYGAAPAFDERSSAVYALPAMHEQTKAELAVMLKTFTDLGLSASIINQD